jgi:hypothetical protein
MGITASKTPDAPLMLEYVGADDYDLALEHLRKTMQRVGIQEC